MYKIGGLILAKITSIYVNPENKAKILSIYAKNLSQWPVPYECCNVPTSYGSTHIIVSGPKDAPPIVLMHGRGGTATMWLPNVLALSRDYRVYALDTIGDFGKSELEDIDNYPKNGKSCSDWLVEVFNGLGINQAFVIGESMGGWITMNLSIFAPERVKGIILLAPVGISSTVGYRPHISVQISACLHLLDELLLRVFGTRSLRLQWL
jgi:pimeloyl-ACP methyl ester carboxylesterase